MASETVVISPAGTANVSPGPLDSVDSSTWIPGSTWSFQWLYRDSGSAPVPLATTANAYRITFQ